MVTGAKKVNFPKPGATKQKEDITMVDAERITQKIIDHTGELAREAGWAGAAIAKDAITGHTSGMVLLRAKKTTITPEPVASKVVGPKALKG